MSSKSLDTQDPSSLPGSTNEKGNDYLWLLSVDLLVFIFLTYLTHLSSKKESKNQNFQFHFQEFRSKFIQGLVISNGVRAFSIFIILITSNNSGNSATSWINYLSHAIPSFFFVSAYMCLIIFLAETYYSASSYHNHLIKPALLMFAISCYTIIALISLFTFGSIFLYNSI